MAEEMQKLSPEELKALRKQLQEEAKLKAGNKGPAEPEKDTQTEEEPENADGKNISIEVSEDGMSASVTLSLPNPGEKYTVPEIVSRLRSNRIVLGMKTQDIMEALNKELYEEPFEVAVGKEVQEGTEGYYEFAVDMDPHTTPEIREDGTCDYSAMGRLANIAEGDLIATYHPAVQGIKGYTVLGAEIMPKYVKDQAPLRGKYITYDDETKEYRATVAGKISCSNSNVEILTVHEINNDIDMATGNVEFYGDIVINGNVEAGVTVRAGRNVTIGGTVSGARIFAGGDIVLSKGMQGNNKGVISARGDVYAEFIEYANVDSRGVVHSNSLINCSVNAGTTVEVDGKRGQILGGYTHGLKGVTFRTAGNITELKTEIHAGFKPEDYDAYVELVKKEKDLKSEAATVVEEMSGLLSKVKKTGADDKLKAHIMELKTSKDEIYGRIETNEQDKKRLAARMSEGANASILCKGTVHTGTLIGIDIAQIKILADESYFRYICRNELIERRTVSIGEK